MPKLHKKQYIYLTNPRYKANISLKIIIKSRLHKAIFFSFFIYNMYMNYVSYPLKGLRTKHFNTTCFIPNFSQYGSTLHKLTMLFNISFPPPTPLKITQMLLVRKVQQANSTTCCFRRYGPIWKVFACRFRQIATVITRADSLNFMAFMRDRCCY